VTLQNSDASYQSSAIFGVVNVGSVTPAAIPLLLFGLPSCPEHQPVRTRFRPARDTSGGRYFWRENALFRGAIGRRRGRGRTRGRRHLVVGGFDGGVNVDDVVFRVDSRHLLELILSISFGRNLRTKHKNKFKIKGFHASLAT
jgi:hypothetical protein